MRKPTAQMARLAPVAVPPSPSKLVGLSAGMLPSGLIRRTLPSRVVSDWALGPLAFSPTATYSLPSGPNASGPPLWLVADESGSRLSSTTALPGAATFPSAVNRMTWLNGSAPWKVGTVK